LFALRSNLDVTILRSPGTTWTTTATGGIANFYDLQIINKTPNDLPYSLRVLSPSTASIIPLGLPTSVAKDTIMKGRFLITLPKKTGENQIGVTLAVESDGKVMKRITTEFLTP
ncbi:MAG: FixG Ig-like domain-containing protein, partial [Candidatus Kapaibacterium sp.]